MIARSWIQPLVAYFSAGDARHGWAVQQFAALAPPLLTCEPVIAETCFLLARQGVAGWRLLEKLDHADRVARPMRRRARCAI